MAVSDPYSPTSSEFECASCGERLASHDDSCSTLFCDGDIRNIAVPRE